MANSIQIHIDTSEVEKKMEVLKDIKGGAQKAIMRAMNKTVTGMKTDAKKEVAARYTIKQKDVAAKLVVKKAYSSDLSIEMSSTGRPIRLAHFSIKPNKSPGKKGGPTVYATVKKGGGGYTGGFMATMNATNGITGVFKRTGKNKHYKGRFKEAIEQLYGPGIVQMLDNDEVKEAIQEKATERFNKELDHQIQYLLNQGKG